MRGLWGVVALGPLAAAIIPAQKKMAMVSHGGHNATPPQNGTAAAPAAAGGAATPVNEADMIPVPEHRPKVLKMPPAKASGAPAATASEDWEIGGWSKCSVECGQGTMTREVKCKWDVGVHEDGTFAHPPGKRCNPSTKPVCEKSCVRSSPSCSQGRCGHCSVAVFGSNHFKGWTTNFTDGLYDSRAMNAKGAHCQDISSIKVSGSCCHVRAYKYPNCKGDYAEFTEGEYTTEEIKAEGMEDNDISCLMIHSGSSLLAPVIGAVAFLLA